MDWFASKQFSSSHKIKIVQNIERTIETNKQTAISNFHLHKLNYESYSLPWSHDTLYHGGYGYPFFCCRYKSWGRARVWPWRRFRRRFFLLPNAGFAILSPCVRLSKLERVRFVKRPLIPLQYLRRLFYQNCHRLLFWQYLCWPLVHYFLDDQSPRTCGVQTFLWS